MIMGYAATIMSKEEAMLLPVEKRPLCFRLPSDLYHAIFEAVGAASMCWKSKPSEEVFDATDEVFDAMKAEKIAVDLCFKVAEALEKQQKK